MGMLPTVARCGEVQLSTPKNPATGAAWFDVFPAPPSPGAGEASAWLERSTLPANPAATAVAARRNSLRRSKPALAAVGARGEGRVARSATAAISRALAPCSRARSRYDCAQGMHPSAYFLT